MGSVIEHSAERPRADTFRSAAQLILASAEDIDGVHPAWVDGVKAALDASVAREAKRVSGK